MSVAKTVKIRIPVAVSNDGHTAAYKTPQYGEVSDTQQVEFLLRNYSSPYHIVYVTAEVTLPSAPEVQGEVE